MEKKSKLKTIYDAFTQEADVSQELYNERLEICNACEYNTANKASEDIGMADKLKMSTICKGSEVCTACGCCILVKIGQKTTECGLAEKGLTPKWNAVKIETSKDSDLNIEILDKSALTIDLESNTNIFEVNAGDVTSTVLEIKLEITRTKGLKISTIKPACQCTVPVSEQIDENTVRVVAKVNTTGFGRNARFSKSITVHYFVSGTGTRSAIIKLTGIKR